MKHIGWIIFSFFTIVASAQDRLVVSGTGTNLYVTKTIRAPQLLSSLAEQYNVPLTVMSRLNNLDTKSNLLRGEEIKIPLTKDNFIQRNIIGKYQPVFHIFKAGENLSKISLRYNKLNIDSIKHWNILPDEIVVDSKPLIIGFISNTRSIYSAAGYQAIAYDTLPNPNVFDAAKFGAKELKGEIKPVPIPVPLPPAVLPVVKTTSPANDNPANTNSGRAVNNPALNASASSALPFATRKPLLVAAPTLVQTEGDFSYRPRSNDEGYFAHTYYQRIKDRAYQAITGDAAIFKTISGWNDRKFYVLINEIIPGTIVRITAANKKSICAKVLGPLPETKGAAGLVIRMNNAAAAALNIFDQRFIVTITYVEY
ncbi:MAG: LysM peptidoglycan-binding domain-containing protein [Chitinophagaceae bacterium]|nr:LysM peptidoglycan-binding domain-containing protein [Chitinophagaceae bacterium]